MKTKPRIAAAGALENILSQRHFSNRETSRWIKGNAWSPEDQRLFLRLVYGTLEQLLLIDHILSKIGRRPITTVDVPIRGILRISAYQLLFTHRIPTYAVIHEAVQYIKKEKPHAAGFVNAVLRSLQRDIKTLGAMESVVDVYCRESISLRYSHPQWLVDKLYSDYPQEEAQKIIQAHQNPPSLTLRLNTQKDSPAQISEMLAKEGIIIEPTGWLPEAWRVVSLKGLITESVLYRKGYFSIQSITSMLAVHWLDPKAGDIVIDIAAAPGGKTMHIAQRMDNQGTIIARDVSEKRSRQITEHGRRLNVNIVSVQVMDGTLSDSIWQQKADKVLLDAPCSGLGMIRKKPEIKFMNHRTLDHFPELQRVMLDRSAELVKPGGVLLYATCTYLYQENQQVILDFIHRNREFTCIPLKPVTKPDKSGLLNGQSGMIQLGPHLHLDLDGFFIAKMIRKR